MLNILMLIRVMVVGDHYVEEQSSTMLKINGATSCCVVYGSGAGQVTCAHMFKYLSFSFAIGVQTSHLP